MPLQRTLEPEVMDTVEEAVDYDSMNHTTVNRMFVQDLLRFSAETSSNDAPSSVGTIIDVGTGSALIPLELIRVTPDVGPIIAVDLSVEMLRLAIQHFRNQTLTARILPLLSDAKRLPVADASCEVVISNSIVHHIPHPAAVFHELHRIIKPGGVLFLRDLMRPDTTTVVEQLVDQYAGSENLHQQQLFRQSLHAALTVDEVRELLDRTGFAAATVNATSDRHWTVTARMPQL
ncbi:MAG: class I SAM-dependent methyltransferase [Fuerstiella sp.]|nr:class I SAM-dependent methyltransferase [Fuerstiella sp.]